MRALLFLAALLPILVAPAVATPHVTVHLVVDTAFAASPLATCDVTVPAGADAGAVLDQAVADGCLLEWTATEDPTFGRYVASIDFVPAQGVFFWSFLVNGAWSDVGIDFYEAQQGDTVTFTYDEWATFLVGSLLP